jgi:hypothetical protein
MHTRRVGAFLIGAWLMGSLLIAFVSSQSYANVDRFFATPPAQVSQELDDIGPDVMRQILRFQASQHDRHISETWLMAQLGLGCALLVTSVFTGHRSRIVIVGSALMTLFVAVMYFYLTPIMNALARSYDFLPASAPTPERQNFNHFAVWNRILEIFKAVLGLLVAARLLLDRNDWQEALVPSARPAKSHRRRRRKSSQGTAPAAPPATETAQADFPEGQSS